MKILQCSDAHGDWLTQGVYRYEDVRSAMLQTSKVACDEKVDLYLFTGDLTNPDDGPRALRAARLALGVGTRLAERGIASWWVRGNHDVFEDGSDESTLTILREANSDLIRVFDHPMRLMLPGKPKLSAGAPAFAIILPYPSATNPYDPAAFVRQERRMVGESSNVLVAAHLHVRGATPGDETTEMSRGREVFFPSEECSQRWLLVNGHYHNAQMLEDAGRRIAIPGSLVRLNHGDEKIRPRYLLWEL